MSLPFLGGPNEKANSQLLPGESISSLVDCHPSKEGKLSGRAGYYNVAMESYGTNSGIPLDPDSPKAIINVHGEAIVFDGNFAWKYLPGQDKFLKLGMCPTGTVFSKAIDYMTQQSTCVDSASFGNYCCFIYNQYNDNVITGNDDSFEYVITYGENFDVISHGQIDATLTNVRFTGLRVEPMEDENSFAVISLESNSGSAPFTAYLHVLEIGSDQVSVTTASTGITDVGTAFSYGVTVDFVSYDDGASTKFFLAYQEDSTNYPKVRRFDDTPTILQTYSDNTLACDGARFCYSDSGGYGYLVSADTATDDITAHKLSETLSLQGGWPVTLQNGGASDAYETGDIHCQIDPNDADGFMIAYTQGARHSRLGDECVYYEYYDDTGSLQSLYQICNARVAGKPVNKGTRNFLPVFSYGDREDTADKLSSIYLWDTTNDVLMGVAEPLTNLYPYQLHSVDANASVFGDSVIFTYQYASRVTGDSSYSAMARVFGVNLADVNVSSATYGDGALISTGNALYFYDRERVVLNGFLYNYPYDMNLGTAAGIHPAGNYGIKILYSWTNALGYEHRGAPNTGGTSIIAGLNSPTTTLVPNANSAIDKTRPDGETIVYETDTNGTIHYIAKRYTWDTATSATLPPPTTTNEILYTDNGELSNRMPSAPLHVVSSGRYSAMIDATSRDKIWVSKPHAESLAVEFNPTLVYNVGDGVECTALAFMDGKLFFFSVDKIGHMTGSNPNALGSGGFTGVRSISDTIGAESHHSVIQIPMGILFKSEKGFYLLSRALQVEYIGAPVDDSKSDTCVSSFIIRDLNQVRFVMSTGNVLVYSWDFNTWSEFSYFSSIIGGVNYTGDSLLNESILLNGSNVSICRADRFHDIGASPTFKVTTGWVKLDALQGWMRVQSVRLLGDITSAAPVCKVTMKSYVNYEESSAAETVLLAVDHTSLNPGGGVGPLDARQRLQVQKVSSIKFEITVEYVSGSGVCPVNLTGISLKIGAKRGLSKNLQASHGNTTP